MGFRFRRRFTVMPGVRLNLSKSGLSTSIGTRGAWFTFGRRGARTTVGVPGTGISYTKTLTPTKSRRSKHNKLRVVVSDHFEDADNQPRDGLRSLDDREQPTSHWVIAWRFALITAGTLAVMYWLGR